MPNRPFGYGFLNQRLERLYQSERRFGQTFRFIAGLAVTVACLGLYGLVAFTTERRTKEIGIRKILGASGSNLLVLLSKEFLILILAANLVAWPVGYVVMNHWLQNFPYHTQLDFTSFLLGSLLTLFIALVIVVHQILKATRANPVDALRYE